MGPIDSDTLNWLVTQSQGAESLEAQTLAFGEVTRHTYPSVHNLACVIAGNPEDGADIAQEVYIRAWKGRNKFRGDAQFSTWLYRIVQNTALSFLRKRSRRREEATPFADNESNDVITLPTAQRSEIPDLAMDDLQFKEDLLQAIAQMPTRRRGAALLRFAYGLPHEEIAQVLGISVNAAKIRSSRGGQQLRESLANYDSPILTVHAPDAERNPSTLPGFADR